MGLFDRSKKKQPKTLYDQFRESADPLIVSRYRGLAAANGAAPTAKTSDQKILEIYQQVASAFGEAARECNQHIPAGSINTIVWHFFQVYEQSGERWYYDHLKYEVDKYINEGLRESYKRELNLF